MTILSSVLTLVFTIITYACFVRLYEHFKRSFLNPVIGTSIVCMLYLSVFDISISAYKEATFILDWLLGPATVALAIPLYRHISILKKLHWRILLPICLGGMLAPCLSWLSLAYFDILPKVKMTMLVKSITTPLAMQTADLIGGIASLAALTVVLTGIVVAVSASLIFSLLKIDNPMVQGIGMGTIGHAIATAKANEFGDMCVAFASLSLCINGCVTSILLPILFA